MVDQSIDGLKEEVKKLRGLNHFYMREDRAYKNYNDALMINIGAGSFYHRKWTNLDVSSDHYEKIQPDFVEYDMTSNSPMALESNSVALAYTSHAIEHVKDDDVQYMFNEVYRALQSGGVFRITCPDANLFYLSAKFDTMDRFFYRTQQWFLRSGLTREEIANIDYLRMAIATGLVTTPTIKKTNQELYEGLQKKFETMDQRQFLDFLSGQVRFSVKHIARHVNWWTHKKVDRFLQNAGFEIIRPSTYGGSMAAPMCDIKMFDNTMPDESLYMEAIKH